MKKILILCGVLSLAACELPASSMLSTGIDQYVGAEWSVIKSGTCITFRHKRWIYDGCYFSVEVAKKRMLEFKEFSENSEKRYSRKWEDVKE